MSFDRITSKVKGMDLPNLDLPYRSGDDSPKSIPFAPRSVNITSPYTFGVIDIRWDDTAFYHEHVGLRIIGVNVYRAFDAPDGAYQKVNAVPVSGSFYRDSTDERLVIHEDVLPSLNPGNNPNGEWYFHTLAKPIVSPGTDGEIGTNYKCIKVEVDRGDGIWVEVPAFKVDGKNGRVVLNTNRIYDNARSVFVDPILPDLVSGGIRATYRYLPLKLDLSLNRKIYYKVTTVAQDNSNGTIIETPLSEAPAKNLMDIENMDYIWKEAVRRNTWIRIQGAEDALLFIRKWNGAKCSCVSEEYGRSKNAGVKGKTCMRCFNTGFIGGYEGPYQIKMAPPDAEKSVQLMDAGLKISYSFNTWIGPVPLVNDRDIVVRQNGDRFIVSNANPTSVRGCILQQSFQLEQLPSNDTAYYLPINGGQDMTPPEWNAYRSGKPTPASPVLADKPGLESDKKLVARTVTFENIMS